MTIGNNALEPPRGNPLWPVNQQGNIALPTAFDYPGYEGPPDRELNLATIWRIVWEWRWLIMSALAVGIGGAIVATLLATPTYKSMAVLEINPPTVEVMENNKASSSSAANEYAFLETQSGLLQSRSLAERVAQDLNLANNDAFVPVETDRSTRQRIATGILRSNLTVDSERESRLIRITYESEDPVLAARVVNGFADAFISTNLERRYEASSYARDFLQRQIANVRRDLETSERQLVGYAQQQGIINTAGTQEGGSPSDTSSLTGESLVALNRTLAEVTARRMMAEQRYRQSLGSANSAEVSERTNMLRTQLAGLQAEYQEKLQLFQPEYPEMVQMRARIQGLEEAIRGESRNVLQGRSETLRTEYQAAVSEERQIRGRVEELRRDVLDLRGRSIRYTILQRDVDTNRALYDALLQRYKEIGVAGGIGNSQASVVDRGEVPSGPSSPNLIFNLLVGIALGLGLGVGTAMILEFLSDTIKTPDDVRNRLRLAFLGGVPSAAKNRRPIEELQDSTSQVSEAYFSAATSLQFTTENGVPKTLLITSTRPAEGKSTTIWALAQHFARLGRSVLLIDADLRKPAFVTGAEKDDGLSTLLTSRDPVQPHCVPVDNAPGLWLLPCGPLPPNPAELLSSPRLQSVLDEAASQFDLVIVDGPPILGLADAPLLSKACRGTLMVIEAGKTRSRAAIEALNRVRSAGSTVVGAILTRYRHEATGYGYSYEAYAYKSVEKSRRQIRAISTDAQ